MNPDDLAELDEDLTSLLAAGDDSLARGKTPTDLASSAPPHGLGQDLAFLHVLRQALRRPTPGAHTGGLPANTPVSLGNTPHTHADSPDLSAASPSLTQLDRFAIRHELGRGGFGVVYLAHDPLLNRDVALKVPRAEVLVTPGWRERFRREAQAAAGLEHPHIVPVYEAGQAGAVAFLVSAYCPGPTLA